MRVVLAGYGQYGRKAAEKLLEKFPQGEITVIDRAGCFYHKRKLALWIIEEIDDTDFFLSRPEAENLRFINDKAERINFNSRSVYLKDSGSISFDRLILCCGSLPKRKSIPGENKKGVFYLTAVSDPLDVKQRWKMFENICIYVSTSIGLEFAEILTKQKKNIKVFLDLGPRISYQARDFFASKGVDAYPDIDIVEIFGEADSRAVKLSSGKIIAADVIFIDAESMPNLNLLKNSGYISTFEEFSWEKFIREIKNVYICGEMADTGILERKVFPASRPDLDKLCEDVVGSLDSPEGFSNSFAFNQDFESLEELVARKFSDMPSGE